jgi:hypothetical protein
MLYGTERGQYISFLSLMTKHIARFLSSFSNETPLDVIPGPWKLVDGVCPAGLPWEDCARPHRITQELSIVTTSWLCPIIFISNDEDVT